MNKTEIKELVDKVYAISWCGFPLDTFLNDIGESNDPRYDKNKAYVNMKLIVDEIYRLRDKAKKYDDKETPKKVCYTVVPHLTIEYEKGFDYFYCPSCGEYLNERLIDDYCSVCGQKLDWSDENGK